MKHTDLKCAGIYAIRHTATGKVYVGQSKQLAKRIRDHQRRSSCDNLRQAIECDGWEAFTVEVLERVDDVALLNEREQYWMDTLQAYDQEHGYNATSKAFGPSEATRNKMRAAKLGRKLSPEHIANITRNHARGGRPEPTEIYLCDATKKQVQSLIDWGHGTLTDIVQLAIDRMYMTEQRRSRVIITMDMATLPAVTLTYQGKTITVDNVAQARAMLAQLTSPLTEEETA